MAQDNTNNNSPLKISADEIEKEATGVEFQIEQNLQRKQDSGRSQSNTISFDDIAKRIKTFAREDIAPKQKEERVTPPLSSEEKSFTQESSKEYKAPFIKKPIVRTFQSDISDIVKKGNISVSKVALAEVERRRGAISATATTNSNINHRRNIIIGAVSFLLFVSGAVSLGLGFFTDKNDASLQESFMTSSMIFVGSQKEIQVTDNEREQLLTDIAREIKETDIRLNAVVHIYFTHIVSGAIELLPSTSFFELMAPDIPSALLRSLSKDYLFGIHAFNGNTPFLIARVAVFDNAFSGMLKWEKTLADEVLPFFGEKNVSSVISQKRFEDEIFKNRDIRVLRDKDGKLVLAYAFPSPDTFVITTDISTLDEVIRRLLTSSR